MVIGFKDLSQAINYFEKNGISAQVFEEKVKEFFKENDKYSIVVNKTMMTDTKNSNT